MRELISGYLSYETDSGTHFVIVLEADKIGNRYKWGTAIHFEDDLLRANDYIETRDYIFEW